MTDYRLYCLDSAGRIDLADWIQADSDDAAIAMARRLKRNGQKCEVWRKTQLVATLGADELHNPLVNLGKFGDSLVCP